MKLKITICGPKVHDVGYMPSLMVAFSLCLRGFEVFNDELNDQQSVVALIEGDDARINRFRKMVNSTLPPSGERGERFSRRLSGGGHARLAVRQYMHFLCDEQGHIAPSGDEGRHQGSPEEYRYYPQV